MLTKLPYSATFDHEITLNILEFIFNSIGTWFFTFLDVYLSWIKQEEILISQLLPSKFRYYADQNGPKGDLRKTNFDNFQMQKWGS